MCKEKCNLDCIYGKCVENTCICEEGYLLSKDNPTLCLPVCKKNCENSFCKAPEKCECLHGYQFFDQYSCIKPETFSSIEIPTCDSECQNGECIAPNKCHCYDGYTQGTNQFECILSSDTDNSTELIQEECDDGFAKDESDNCHQICDKECHNSECVNDECQCLTGYSKINATHCGPECDPPCLNGVCIGPNKCLCDEAFQTLFNAQCKPKCEQSCINGTCVGLNDCECNKGKQLF